MRKDVFSKVLLLMAISLFLTVDGATQHIDRKLMKKYNNIRVNGQEHSTKWIARYYAENNKLMNDSILFIQNRLLCMAKTFDINHRKLSNWVHSTAKTNGFCIIEDRMDMRHIVFVCNFQNLCHRSICNKTWDVSVKPTVELKIMNKYVDVILYLSKYYVHYTYDKRIEAYRNGILIHSGPYWTHDYMWNICDCYPYDRKSHYPKLTCSRALVSAFSLAQELTQLVGEVIGVRKQRETVPEWFF